MSCVFCGAVRRYCFTNFALMDQLDQCEQQFCNVCNTTLHSNQQM